jgi:hypothetical protein
MQQLPAVRIRLGQISQHGYCRVVIRQPWTASTLPGSTTLARGNVDEHGHQRGAWCDEEHTVRGPATEVIAVPFRPG